MIYRLNKSSGTINESQVRHLIDDGVLSVVEEPVYVRLECVAHGCSDGFVVDVIHDCEPGYVLLNEERFTRR